VRSRVCVGDTLYICVCGCVCRHEGLKFRLTQNEVENFIVKRFETNLKKYRGSNDIQCTYVQCTCILCVTVLWYLCCVQLDNLVMRHCNAHRVCLYVLTF
jgi:hypothetical protein